MRRFEAEAKELFDMIDGPFISLTPLGEKKMGLIEAAFQKAYNEGLLKAIDVVDDMDNRLYSCEASATNIQYDIRNAIRKQLGGA